MNPLDDQEIREMGYEPTAKGWRPIEPTERSLREAVVDGVQLTSLDGVKMRRPKMAWDPRIPLGSVTITAGLPGQGKSTLIAWLTARLTRGQLAGDLEGQPCDVVIATAEDALSFTLKPRLHAAGADLTRVNAIGVHRDGLDVGISIPDDLAGVQQAMERTGARLLVVDPLLAHIPVRIDGYKDQHVRVALAPLAKMAEDLDAAIVAIMHLNKRETADLFSRLGGSGGFLAAARSAMLIAPDPDDSEIRIIAHGKANLTPEAESLRFRLEPQEIPNPDPEDPKPIRVASVAMLGESDLTVESLLRASHATARGDAMSWLVQALTNGPMPVTWLKNAAEEAGHAWRTVEAAKHDLGVKADRVGGLGKEGRWEWTLP